jgi:hypothetical protein
MNAEHREIVARDQLHRAVSDDLIAGGEIDVLHDPRADRVAEDVVALAQLFESPVRERAANGE